MLSEHPKTEIGAPGTQWACSCPGVEFSTLSNPRGNLGDRRGARAENLPPGYFGRRTPMPRRSPGTGGSAPVTIGELRTQGRLRSASSVGSKRG